MHSPEYAEEVGEARRLGGLRRRREVAVSGAFDFVGLETVVDIRRLLVVAVLDTLGLENSIARNRTLAYLATSAIKLLEMGELEDRLASLEAAVHGQKSLPESVFNVDPVDSGFTVEAEA
jgi:hypothetical protein